MVASATRSGGFAIAGGFIILAKFWLHCGCFYANAATFPQQYQWLRDCGGSSRTREWAVLNRGDDLPYSTAFWWWSSTIYNHTYTHTHTAYIHWDYGNAEAWSTNIPQCQNCSHLLLQMRCSHSQKTFQALKLHRHVLYVAVTPAYLISFLRYRRWDQLTGEEGGEEDERRCTQQQ